MRLSFHHVGGRWGTIPPIVEWGAFASILELTVYEPDIAAAEQIPQRFPKEFGYASLNVQTDCLGQCDGISDFHLAYDRNASSMLPFDAAYSDFCFFTDRHDRGVYILGTANRSDVIKVNVRSLGSLIAEGKTSAPDVLSIDAEGATLEILKGLDDRNLKNVVGLFLESSALPYHKGERPFHELLQYVSERGFFWVDLGQVGRYSLSELHIGAFDRGVFSYISDALFLRDPATVDDPEVLQKLALVSLLCGVTSFAYACFKKLEASVQPLPWLQPSTDVGLNFLNDFYRTYCAYRELKLPKIDETWNLKSFNYGQYSDIPPDEESMHEQTAHRINALRKYVPILLECREVMKTVPPHDALYEKYSLPELARAAREERVKQMNFLVNMLASVRLIKFTKKEKNE